MKQDNRNCAVPYPIYPPYQGMGMMPYNSMPYPIPFTSNPNMNNNFNDQINSINEQLNSLDKRVAKLENDNLNTNNYSSSNYQIM